MLRNRVVVTALSFLALPTIVVAQDIPNPKAGPEGIVQLSQDVEVGKLLERLKVGAPSRTIVIRNIKIVDPVAASVLPGQSVIINAGKILWVGHNAVRDAPAGATQVDGHGAYLAPGLTDSHFHSHSPAAPLVNLANGVTTVREMDGFPWMLHWRANARNRRMLAPYPYVASQIINGNAMGGFAIVPKSVDDARAIVRQQAACGFEFIKVHNIVPLDQFDAIAAEAKTVGLPLVGHVPQDIPVRHAAEAGMRTMEHLKGWLNDHNLELGDRDYKVAADFPSLWVVPTLYATHESLRGATATALLDSQEGAYIPPADRAELRGMVDEAPNRVLIARQAQLAKMDIIMRELHKVGARFLVGTDADGMPFTIAGFGVTEEMRMMMDAGLSAPEVLRAATSEPALAFGHPGAFGQVKPGMRADLVLLPRNPLEDPMVYRDNLGVMINGRWLSHASLAAAMAKVRELFADKPAPAINANRLASDVERLSAVGYVIDAASLGNAANALRAAGKPAPARRLAAIASTEDRCPLG